MAVGAARTSWPWTTLIGPAKPVKLPVSVTVSLPVLTSAPGPLSALFMLTLSERSSTSVPPMTMAMPPVRLPLVPPLPSCSVPAEIVVPPREGVAAQQGQKPVPACVRLPLPLMTPPNVEAPGRLKTRTPLSISGPVPKLPATMPLPTCSVPPEIVVPPL